MHKVLATLTVVLLTTGSLLASEKTDVLESVTQFLNALNKSDIETATAHCAEEMTIIEHNPPHEWHGKKAFSQWWEYYKADAKKNGITDLRAIIGRSPGESPIVETSGDAATAVVSMHYSYKQNGKSMEQTEWGMTCNLLKPKDRWIITFLTRVNHQ